MESLYCTDYSEIRSATPDRCPTEQKHPKDNQWKVCSKGFFLMYF